MLLLLLLLMGSSERLFWVGEGSRGAGAGLIRALEGKGGMGNLFVLQRGFLIRSSYFFRQGEEWS